MFTVLHPTLFPIPPNLKMSSQPTFSTTVLGDISGDSQSIINRDFAIWTWTLQFIKHNDDWGTALGYFLARRGRGYGGLIQDPFDNRSTDHGGQGRVKLFPDGFYYLCKMYPDEFAPYYRVIRCADLDNVTFSGVSGSPTMEPYTGRVLSATSEGDAEFDFICPFAFSSDMMQLERDPVTGTWNVELHELTRFTVATP